MNYGDWTNALNTKFEKTKEIGKNTLEVAIGFSESFFIVGSSHLIAPTLARKLWNSYNDNEIHKYLPIHNKSNRAKGRVLGTIGGVATWTLQYLTLIYLAKNGDPNYHLLPLLPLIGSAVWEINRIHKNRKAKRRESEEISAE